MVFRAFGIFILTVSASACRTLSPLPDMRSPEDFANDIAPKCKGTEDPTTAILTANAIDSVEPAYSYVQSGPNPREARLRGARIHIAPLPGATRESLARAVECHEALITLGRIASIPDDPTILPGQWIDTRVDSEGDGFVVTAAIDDIESAREVLARARRFTKRHDFQAPVH